jgi:POT family proton-dependent oligopeptide transporter
MVIATVIFWMGRRKFVHIAPGGKNFLRETFTFANLVALGRLAIIFVFVAVFWSLWDQSGGEWVLQAAKMNLHFAGIDWIASQVQAVNAIMILAFIPLFQYLVYPAISRVFPLTPLRKIGIGLVVAGASFLVSAWIETQIKAGLRPSIGWQLPAYALLSAAEIMVSITSLEFSYTQAPKSMKSIVSAIYLWSISAGNAFTALVHVFIQNKDGTLKLEGASYYLFFAGLSAAAALVFAFVALRYREKTHLQDGSAGGAPQSGAAPAA